MNEFSCPNKNCDRVIPSYVESREQIRDAYGHLVIVNDFGRVAGRVGQGSEEMKRR